MRPRACLESRTETVRSWLTETLSCGSARLDLEEVPLELGLRNAQGRHDADDRAGRVVAVGVGIEDVDLVAGLRARGLGIGAADEDAGIGAFLGPELEPKLEVAVGLLGDEEALAVIGGHGLLGDAPIGGADLIEGGERFVVLADGDHLHAGELSSMSAERMRW